MKRFVFGTGAFALVAASVTLAQDPKPNPFQPDPKTAKAGQPGGGKATRPGDGQPGGGFQPTPKDNPWSTGPTRVTPAKMAQLEEEFEMIDAHREVRKAYIRAAEVAVKSAEINFDLMNKSGAAVPQSELAKAKLEVEAARAQLEIRLAELKEVEVKIKFAKKRLDDAKAATVRPVPKVDPKPIDPPPAQ
jgi:hypothetical protein